MSSAALRSHSHHKSKNKLCVQGLTGFLGSVASTGFQHQLSFTLIEAEVACAGVIVEVSLPSAVRSLEIPDV